MPQIRYLATVPSATCALVSKAELLSPDGAQPTPLLVKTYLRHDITRYDLIDAVYAERTALVRLSDNRTGLVARLLAAAVTPTALKLTMIRAPGQSASQLARPLPLKRAAAIIKQLCTALSIAHKADIVHADVTLRNVLVDTDSRDAVCLVDFGSCFIRGGRHRDPSRTTSAHVLAPELLLGTQPDPTSDIWALGVFAWSLMFGGPGPFGADVYLGASDAVVLQELQGFADGSIRIEDRIQDAVVKLSSPPEQVESAREFLMICLAKNPSERFARPCYGSDLRQTPWSEVVDYNRIYCHPFIRLAPD